MLFVLTSGFLQNIVPKLNMKVFFPCFLMGKRYSVKSGFFVFFFFFPTMEQEVLDGGKLVCEFTSQNSLVAFA